jgi:hypothetical protein
MRTDRSRDVTRRAGYLATFPVLLIDAGPLPGKMPGARRTAPAALARAVTKVRNGENCRAAGAGVMARRCAAALEAAGQAAAPQRRDSPPPQPLRRQKGRSRPPRTRSPGSRDQRCSGDRHVRCPPRATARLRRTACWCRIPAARTGRSAVSRSCPNAAQRSHLKCQLAARDGRSCFY